MADFQKPLILFEKIRGHSWTSEKNENKWKKIKKITDRFFR
jgi:hypothetical protein